MLIWLLNCLTVFTQAECQPCMCFLHTMRCNGFRVTRLPRIGGSQRGNITKISLRNTLLKKLDTRIYPLLHNLILDENILLNCASIEINTNILVSGDCLELNLKGNPITNTSKDNSSIVHCTSNSETFPATFSTSNYTTNDSKAYRFKNTSLPNLLISRQESKTAIYSKSAVVVKISNTGAKIDFPRTTPVMMSKNISTNGFLYRNLSTTLVLDTFTYNHNSLEDFHEKMFLVLLPFSTILILMLITLLVCWLYKKIRNNLLRQRSGNTIEFGMVGQEEEECSL